MRAADKTRTFASLFSGIGGFDLGLERTGSWRSALLCENDPAAQRVLRARFPSVPLVSDVRDVRELLDVDLVTAGFPCKDLSQAGTLSGIHEGVQSSLVKEVFRLLETSDPPWLLLENVPNMLCHRGGEAIDYITEELERLGFRWAYRTVDTRAFGVPQRRLRVYLLASRHLDPRGPLYEQDAGDFDESRYDNGEMFGFSWSEGFTGLGWTPEGVPTLRCGSSEGIPSPPAIWVRSTGEFIVPSLADVERLQGFPVGWTSPADVLGRKSSPRWGMVGNAVSVPVIEWLGERMLASSRYVGKSDALKGDRWPAAVYSGDDRRLRVAKVGTCPVRRRYVPLSRFLEFPGIPLNAKRTEGFRARMAGSRLRFRPDFRAAIDAYSARVAASGALPSGRVLAATALGVLAGVAAVGLASR